MLNLKKTKQNILPPAIAPAELQILHHLNVDPWRVCLRRLVCPEASDDPWEAAVRVSLHEQDESSQWHEHARGDSDGLEKRAPSATSFWGQQRDREVAIPEMKKAAMEHRHLQANNPPQIFKKHSHSPITCNKVEDTRLPSPSLISYTPSCLEVSLAMTISLVVPFLPSEMRPRYRMSWSVIWPSRISCTEPRGGLGSKGPREDSSGYRVGVNMRWACRMGRKRGRFRDSLVKRVTLKERPG